MWTYLLPGIGMILVAVAAFLIWRRISQAELKWFGVGAGLWLVAIVLKSLASLVSNPALLSFLDARLGDRAVAFVGGILIGVQSSLFEVGLTLVAVLLWRSLGSDSNKAIAIGIGAGSFEALLLGVSQVSSTALALAGVEGTEMILEQLDPAHLPTLFWLVAPVERVIAVLTHGASRALVLLGQPRGELPLVLAGFALFAVLDSIAAGVQIAGLPSGDALWLVEAVLSAAGLISLLVLRRCHRRWSLAA